ncbi:MAG: DeoR/GlpR family DNA-binding transcription regulator [Aquiluna sp.]|nr:DeoR/GlpR family DNA-binding transcription regulator [Aquiluna sp.]
MSRNERINRILELVSKTGALDVDQAANSLKVSLATIRRDFDELANRQLVTRTHGGIQASGAAYDLPIRYKTAKEDRGKQRIARVAAAMVQRGYRIGVNGGTTTTELARELASSHRLHPSDGDIGLTVVTNAINIATEMVIRPHIKIVVTGGVARPQSYELIGDFASSLLDGLVLDIAFLGVNGVDAEVGATANHEGEAKIDQLIADAAKKVVVITTADKIGHQAFARICKPGEIDMIMTDEEPEPAVRKSFEEQGVEIVVC